jgi:hypothetical protein
MYQIRALQGVPGTLILQQAPGHAPQFAVDARSQLPERLRIAVRPGAQKLGGIFAGWFWMVAVLKV